MLRRLCSIAYILAVVMFVGARCNAHGADKTVYEMADGVVRPSLNGTREAYLPIIVNSSHASNLLVLPDGDLLCFWFAGTWEGRSGVSIVMSRLDHRSNRWTLPVVLSNHPGRSDQNPVPFRAPDGRLWLFHTSQVANKGETNSVIYCLTSNDQGHTWTSPQLLFTEPGSFDRQHLVVFHDEWLYPTEIVASGDIITNAQNDRTIVKVSTNGGKAWSDCEVPGSGGLVQMDIVQVSEEHFIAFFRSRYADWIYKSNSTDGCHWSVPVPSQLPNNNSSIQVARLKDEHLVIAFNNTQATTTRGEPRTAPRNILSVALSVDDGKTWPWVRDVQPGNEPPTLRPGEVAEYSYPSVLQTSNGMIQLTFTFRRETVKYMTFDEQWIKQGTTEGVFKGDPKP
jgi:predicted neuraminidase